MPDPSLQSELCSQLIEFYVLFTHIPLLDPYKAEVITFSEKILRTIGDSIHLCRTPFLISISVDVTLSKLTFVRCCHYKVSIILFHFCSKTLLAAYVQLYLMLFQNPHIRFYLKSRLDTTNIFSHFMQVGIVNLVQVYNTS